MMEGWVGGGVEGAVGWRRRWQHIQCVPVFPTSLSKVEPSSSLLFQSGSDGSSGGKRMQTVNIWKVEHVWLKTLLFEEEKLRERYATMKLTSCRQQQNWWWILEIFCSFVSAARKNKKVLFAQTFWLSPKLELFSFPQMFSTFSHFNSFLVLSLPLNKYHLYCFFITLFPSTLISSTCSEFFNVNKILCSLNIITLVLYVGLLSPPVVSSQPEDTDYFS